MGDKPAHLDSKDEPFWDCVAPVLKGLFLGEVVKSIVDLNRLKMIGVQGKPIPLTETQRIKDPVSPMTVVPARGPDEDVTFVFGHMGSLGEKHECVKF